MNMPIWLYVDLCTRGRVPMAAWKTWNVELNVTKPGKYIEYYSMVHHSISYILSFIKYI